MNSDERLKSVLDLIKPGAGSLLGKPVVPAADLAAARAEVARSEAQIASIKAHAHKVQRLRQRIERAERAERANPGKLKDRAWLDEQRADLAKLETLLADADAEIAETRPLIDQVKTYLDQPNAIGVTVGVLAYPSRDRGALPVLPIIVCDFAMAATVEIPPKLTITIDADRRYSIHPPGQRSRFIAACDDPVEIKQHLEFQRLLKLWDGAWALRINQHTQQRDFMIDATGAVGEFEQPLDVLLDLLEQAGGDTDHTNPRAKAWEAALARVAGPDPVPRLRRFPKDPTKIVGRVVHRNGNTQWVQYDRATLAKTLRTTIDGPFMALTYERTRAGVNFTQIMPKEEGNTTAPDIWFRVDPAYKGTPRGKTHTQGTLGVALPVEELQLSALQDLQEDDAPRLAPYYQHRDETTLPARVSTLAADEDDAREVTKTMHAAIVANYLQLCQTMRVAAAGGDANMQRLWPLMRDAMIFELPPAAYTSLFEEFFRYCVRSAKLDPDTIDTHTPKQQQRVAAVIASGKDAPFPEKLPFAACFFAYGGSVPDPAAAAYEKREGRPGRLYGHLVTSTGIVVGMRHVDGPNNKEAFTFFFDRDPQKSQEWLTPPALTPWIVNALVAYVNEHKSLVEMGNVGLGHQMLVKKQAKRLSIKPPVPKPYYVVHMKDTFLREQSQKYGSAIKRHIDWQHRWRVRGHDCIRFVRGPLPLDAETEIELRKRKYQIYTVEQPDSETFILLAKRGVAPKGADEWLAVLRYWRGDFIKGPEDKVLIESVRRSAKEWGEA